MLRNRAELDQRLDEMLNALARRCGVECTGSSVPGRFSELIQTLHARGGQRVVVLIDEYDKPILDNAWYNGYNWTGTSVYNPFDLLLLLQEREFKPYWFEAGYLTIGSVQRIGAQPRYTLRYPNQGVRSSLNDVLLRRYKERGYADKYRARGEPIHLIGVEFSQAERGVVGFEVERLAPSS